MTKRTATEIIDALDATHTLARESALKEAALQNLVPIEWIAVPVSLEQLQGVVYMSKTPIMVGTSCDAVRISVNQITAQEIADGLEHVPEAGAPEGVVLPTAKIADRFHQTAHHLPVFTQAPGPDMQDTARFVKHSKLVDEAIRKAATDKHCSPHGKLRVNMPALQNDPYRQSNYGWYAPGAPNRSVLGIPCWQFLAKGHISGYKSTTAPQGYADYSEWFHVVRVLMQLSGQDEDIREVALHATRHRVISTQGPTVMRHPAVPDPDLERASTVVPPASSPTRPTAPPPRVTRTLRIGAHGEDVRALQRVLGIADDGWFGPDTQKAVKGAQTKHGLAADGVVGPLTRKALWPTDADVPKDARVVEWEPRDAVFMEARYYLQSVKRTIVDHIVLHSAEIGEFPTSAEALGYAGQNNDGKRPASWHWAFDNDSGVMCVPEDRVAFHAKGGNRYTVGYEHAGFARQTREEWLDDYSNHMLWLSAKTAARITIPRWDIPVQLIGPKAFKRARELRDAGQPVPRELRGFLYHSTVTLGAGIVGGHMDPEYGKGTFPFDVYSDYVRQQL